MNETFNSKDLIIDGILNYGVLVGRFIFEGERKIVYALSDLMHIGGSDVSMVFQISKDDYLGLLSKSVKHGLPDFPVPYEITEKYHDIFLCGDSAYGKRNSFTIKEVDLELAESY